MFGQEKTLDVRHNENEETLAQLSNQMKDLEAQAEQLMEKMGVDKGQVKEYVENPDNFSEEQWQEMQILQEALKKRISSELDNVPDVKRTERAFQELGVADRNWIRT